MTTAAGRRWPCHDDCSNHTCHMHRRDGGDQQLITNFEAAAPASYFAELYARDGLHGGHVIMLGPDPESRLGHRIRGTSCHPACWTHTSVSLHAVLPAGGKACACRPQALACK